jgi:manganese/zinc/iron transport system permease protein
MNPYFDNNFFQFIGNFFIRFFQFATFQLKLSELAPDEIQWIVLAAIGVSSALVGSLLILKKLTMLANSLSHTILLGIVLAFLFGSTAKEFQEGRLNLPLLLIAALCTGLVTAFVTEFLTKYAKLQEDASTGLVFTTFFAIGIILINVLTRNAHIGAEVVMGNVDALHPDDLWLSLTILCINLVMIIFLFKEWQITTFDPAFAKALGFSPGFFSYFLLILVSLTVVGAFRAVGVLMVLTFITAPPLTARLFCRSLSTLLISASFIGVAASLIGVALSRHLLTIHGLALSTGGIVVVLLGSIYLFCILITNLRNRAHTW